MAQDCYVLSLSTGEIDRGIVLAEGGMEVDTEQG